MHRGAQAVLTRHRFDVDEYTRMYEAGILDEDDRVELLDGEIVRMHAIGSPHAACVTVLHEQLIIALGLRACVRSQSPLHLSATSMPEPDVLVARRDERRYADGHPTPRDAFLVIEVADASLRKDKDVKLPLYAAAGIPEVWIVDLNAERVEVYREPAGSSYRERLALAEGTASPLAFPDIELTVADILPARR